MNWQQLSQTDWIPALARFYSQLPVRHINKALSLLLILVLAWLAAGLTWLWLPQPEFNRPQPNLSQHAATSGQTSNLEQLLAANLFGKEADKSQQTVVETPVTDAPQTNLNLKLTGVVATPQKPEQGTAIIESNGVELVYAVDEQIEGTSASLRQVLEDRVLLKVSGRMETLMLDGVEYQKLSEANAAIQEGQLQPYQAVPEPMEASPAESEINAMRQEMLAEPAKLFDYIRISPRNRNGQLYGYALLPGKDPDMFARLGLLPNDVAIEMNGVRLDDMQQAYGVINELREAKQVSIKIERDGEIRDIQVNLSQ